MAGTIAGVKTKHSPKTLGADLTIVCLLLGWLMMPNLAFAQLKTADVKTIERDIHVVVEDGEFLTAIVRRVMGSVEFWPEVARINKIESPDALQPGDVIVFPASLVQKRNYARVVFVKGDSKIVRGPDTQPVTLEKGSRVYLGDIIRTGDRGFVSLSFNGESLVNVQPDSNVQIVQFDCFDKEKSCVVNLSARSGQMNFDVRNIGFQKPTLFSIETPYASAAVRGTKFDVDVLDGSAIGVTDGVVVVSSGDETASVPLGKGTLAGEGRSVLTLYDLLVKPVYNDFIRVSAEDILSWQSIAGAENYNVVLSASESLSDVIQSTTTKETYTELLPQAQQYYVGTRALDRNGLKGFTEVLSVNQVAIDESAQAPLLEMELSDNSLKIVNTGNQRSEVHIGTELENIAGLDQLATFDAHDIAPGDTLEVTVDTQSDVYIVSRAVIGRTAVSRYGNIYEFKRER